MLQKYAAARSACWQPRLAKHLHIKYKTWVNQQLLPAAQAAAEAVDKAAPQGVDYLINNAGKRQLLLGFIAVYSLCHRVRLCVRENII
jgi:hypothetical protein